MYFKSIFLSHFLDKAITQVSTVFFVLKKQQHIINILRKIKVFCLNVFLFFNLNVWSVKIISLILSSANQVGKAALNDFERKPPGHMQAEYRTDKEGIWW